MAIIIWFAAGVLLAAGEVLSGEFVLLMLSGGALAGAVAAWLGTPVWLSALVFALMSVGLVLGVRPVLKRHLMRFPGTLTGTEALPGRQATVVSAFGNAGGQVQLNGEIWSARPVEENETFRTGETVIVETIDGATAVVRRRD